MWPLTWWMRIWTEVVTPRRRATATATARPDPDQSLERESALTAELDVRDARIVELEQAIARQEARAEQLQQRLDAADASADAVADPGDADDEDRAPRPVELEDDEVHEAERPDDDAGESVDDVTADDVTADDVMADEAVDAPGDDAMDAPGDDAMDTTDDMTKVIDAGDADSAGGEEAAGAVIDEQPDMSGAADVLGRKVSANDHTVVEGIGPKIAGLLTAAGITSWRALSETDPADLREILGAAGSRYRMHDPADWPRQAALLAKAQWSEFQELRQTLRRASRSS